VHVNVPATVIKLVAHRSHVNKLNIYNQVTVRGAHVGGPYQCGFNSDQAGSTSQSCEPTEHIQPGNSEGGPCRGPYQCACNSDQAGRTADADIDRLNVHCPPFTGWCCGAESDR
jgi:hypothetical protein